MDRHRDAIRARLVAAIGSECLVQFAVHQSVLPPVEILDEVAVEGSARFVQDSDPFWGEGKNYQSATVEDPTWLQVAILANQMIGVTGDQQHVYLEGLSHVREQGDVGILEFDMGS